MSHELEIKEDGQAAMAWAKSGGLPWHGLGVEVPDDVSTEEMLKAAGLDWTVSLYSSFVEKMVDGKRKRLGTGMKGLVRDDQNIVLDQVGPKWNPVQNHEAFDFFREFVEAGDMKMHTAGSLNGGRIVWALAKIDESFEIAGGDRVDSYLQFTNPHQYGKVIDVRFTSTRVVCMNTLNIALKGSKNYVKLNHRRKYSPESVKELLDINHGYFTKFKEKAEYLTQKQMPRRVMEEYFGELLGKSKKDDKYLSRNGDLAMSLLDTQPGKDYAYGSAWHALNTITYMTDHVLGRNNDTRLQSAWYGTNSKLKDKAFELAMSI